MSFIQSIKLIALIRILIFIDLQKYFKLILNSVIKKLNLLVNISRALDDSLIPIIVFARKPEGEPKKKPYEFLKHWNVLKLPSIMRNTKMITDATFDDYSDHTKTDYKTSSVVGVKPVGIILTSMQDDDKKIGLTKALEIATEQGEQKFIILTSEPR